MEFKNEIIAFYNNISTMKFNSFKDAREKALKDINSKKEILDEQINEEIKKAEQEIEFLRKSAPEKINRIAIDTSSDLIKKLIGK